MRRLCAAAVLVLSLLALSGCGEDASWFIYINSGDGNLIVNVNDPPDTLNVPTTPASIRPE